MNDLLLRRRIAVINSTPTTYDSKVNYLKSTGTQYIDTGLVISDTDIIVSNATFDAGVSTTYNQLYAAIGSSSNYIWIRANKTSSTYYIRFGSGSTYNRAVSGINNRHVYTLQKGIFKIDGTNYINNIDYSGMPNASVIIGRITSNASFVGKLYEFIIYNASNTELMHLIPVRVGQVGYMYDEVSGRFFGNDGTGNFILGQDINE